MFYKKLLRSEILFLILFSFVLIRESIFVGFFGTTFFNLSILVFIFFIYIGAYITKDLYLFVFLLVFLTLSVLINVESIQPGGWNTYILFLSALPLLFLKPKEFDKNIMFNGLLVVFAMFLSIVYAYYLLGFQVIPKHLSYILAGPYLNQNTLSMVFLSFLVLFLVYRPRENKLKSLLIAFIYFSILLTQARAALLSATLILLFTYRKKIFFIIPFVVASILSVLFYDSEFTARLVTKFTEAGSAGRMDFWLKAIDDLSQNVNTLLFGNGVGNTTAIGLDGKVLSVHSSYVNFVSDYGLLSFVILMMISAYMLFKAYKVSVLLFVCMFSILIYGLFETVLFTGYSVLWLTLLYIYYTRMHFGGDNAHSNNSI